MTSPASSAAAPSDTPRALVDAAVTAAFEQTHRETAEAGQEAAPVVAAAERAAAGGKRLRALLCMGAARACGAASPTPGDPVVGAGAALELFQAAALVHDDLMDASDTRRGAPATHRHLEAEAFPAGADADADVRARFGTSAALLVGDLLLTMSATALIRAVSPLGSDVSARALATYSAMASEVAVGQYLDLLAAQAPWSPDGSADLDRALRVIRAKSARYSVELPLRLGGTLAGADQRALAWLDELGSHVGTAFQLRDDVLGVFGDPAVTGKPAGDDLREGKRTVLVALAYQEADAQGRSLLVHSLGRADLDPATLAQLRDLLVTTGALAEVEHRISSLASAARDLLASPPPGVSDPAPLAELLRRAVDRSA